MSPKKTQQRCLPPSGADDSNLCSAGEILPCWPSAVKPITAEKHNTPRTDEGLSQRSLYRLFAISFFRTFLSATEFSLSGMRRYRSPRLRYHFFLPKRPPIKPFFSGSGLAGAGRGGAGCVGAGLGAGLAAGSSGGGLGGWVALTRPEEIRP